jgi:DNA-binding NtrC family response regulator
MVKDGALELSLLVARGPDAGARIALVPQAKGRDAPRIVGRAKGTDLQLTDVSVSRRHLEVRLASTGLDARVDVRVCSGAASFLVGGAPRDSATLRPGDEFVIGETVLVVTPKDEPRPDLDPSANPAVLSPTASVTDVQTMLGGATAEVRGLKAIFALTEALDAAADIDAVERSLAEWARGYAGATSARLLVGAAAAQEDLGDRIVERAISPGETRLMLPADGGGPAAIELALPVGPGRVDLALRRLLVIAGRVTGSSLGRLRALRTIEEDNRELRRLALGSAQAFLGSSPAATQVAKLLPKLAASDACVLLLGESGTGKSFAGRLIHEMSPRAREPFRVINCAAIPEALLESELFGHERGAFTGAVASRTGVFEAAGRGTVLLDEIGELPLTSQAKLLRVLEEKRFERIGSNRPLTLAARVLAATNRDLEAMAQAGRFRSDLFFRISVVQVRIPALRERGDDVALLARQILSDLAAATGRRVQDLSPGALAAIRAYPWPGNVRELRNAIEHALVLGDGPTIEACDLPDAVRAAGARPDEAEGAAALNNDSNLIKLPANLEWLEGRAIEAALRATGGNRTRAAALLGINRVTLYKKLKEGPEGG